jgi:hypothetical protein
VAAGPDIRQGQTLDADVLDLAPTILDHFGVAAPAHMIGRVLESSRA